MDPLAPVMATTILCMIIRSFYTERTQKYYAKVERVVFIEKGADFRDCAGHNRVEPGCTRDPRSKCTDIMRIAAKKYICSISLPQFNFGCAAGGDDEGGGMQVTAGTTANSATTVSPAITWMNLEDASGKLPKGAAACPDRFVYDLVRLVQANG